MAIVITNPVEAQLCEEYSQGEEHPAFSAECPVCGCECIAIVERPARHRSEAPLRAIEECDHFYYHQSYSQDDFSFQCQFYFGGVVACEANDPQFDVGLLAYFGSEVYYHPLKD